MPSSTHVSAASPNATLLHRLFARPASRLSSALPPILLALVLVLAACGSGQGAPGSSSPESSGDTEPRVIEITPEGNQMKYATTEIEVKAGTTVRIVMNNTATSPSMVHNVTVLQADASINTVGAAAIQAGEAKGYIPDHDAIIANTEMAKPGERTTVEFTAPPPGDYPYVCLYPGHYATMQGVLHSVE